MPLNKEWQHRVKRWETALWNSCYRPLGEITLNGYITTESLSPNQVLNRAFVPMPPGTPWGAKWEYGWFVTSLISPPEAAGQRLVLCANPADHTSAPGECLVWANGKAIGSLGWARKYITLDRKAPPGRVYDLLIEAYAGHGEPVIEGGPILYGTNLVIEPPTSQCVVAPTTYGIWREDVYQLAIDFSTLLDIHDHLDPRSLRVAEISRGLMEATLIVDPELPEGDYILSARNAREYLQPLLKCTNGSTVPTLYAFGHAHLDIAWLWPLQETQRKIARTIANQVALLEEYPQYTFLQSQPHLFHMLREHYPDIYAQLKSAVSSGRVIADGAMWVEADTNLTGGESLIRQILKGKRFFQDEFDIDSRILWLPDVFGYSGALPQILRSCECDGFATQKITWVYHGGEPFPYNTFLWVGIDGSSIPAHIFTDYNSQTRPSALLERWNTRLQMLGVDKMLLSYGWGDGGGGPTRDHLEFLQRATDLEGVPRIINASPAEFFSDLSPETALPHYVGELYFQAHRGTFTTQARIKQANRRLEYALREAEIWGSLAQVLADYPFTLPTLQSQWHTLLLHQFHDILPGSSIHRVYQEAEAALAQATNDTNAVVTQAAGFLVDQFSHTNTDPDAVTVFNSLSWPRTAVIDVQNGPIEVTIPPCGWTTVRQDSPTYQMPAIDGLAFGSGAAIPARATPALLENEYVQARFNQRGELVSLVEKSSHWEAMAAPGNSFCLFKDIPAAWDAWDIDSSAALQPLPLPEPVSIEVLNPGPLVAQLLLRREIANSTLTQVITLYRSSRRLEFKTTVDWQERHKLLKVAFPINIHATEAIHEIQFGHLRRPTHRSRQFDADRFEVSNHKWSALADELHGAAVLNDSKYGLSVDDSTIKLTLLRATVAPDPLADRGMHTFKYAIYPWTGPLSQSTLVQQAYELNISPLILPGSADGDASIFRVDTPNIILETVKPAEDGSADLILRLYESLHTLTECLLTTCLPITSAWQTNMLETERLPLAIHSGMIQLAFRPFEIKTVRLSVERLHK